MVGSQDEEERHEKFEATKKAADMKSSTTYRDHGGGPTVCFGNEQQQQKSVPK